MQHQSRYQMYLKKGGVAFSLESNDGAFVSTQLSQWERHFFTGIRPAERQEGSSQAQCLSRSTHEERVAYLLLLAQALGKQVERPDRHPEKIFVFPRLTTPPSVPHSTDKPSVSLTKMHREIPADSTLNRKAETASRQGSTLYTSNPAKPETSAGDKKPTISGYKGICFFLFFIALYFILISAKSFLTTPIDNVNAREAAYDIAEAYAAWLEHHVPDEGTTAGVFTPYMHFTDIDTSSHFSSAPAGQNSLEACSKATPCIVLYNGSVVQYNIHNRLGHLDRSKTNGWLFNIDPDGAGGHNGCMTVVQHANGRLETAELAIQKPVIYEGQAVRMTGVDPSYIRSWKVNPPSKLKKLLVETRELGFRDNAEAGDQ